MEIDDDDGGGSNGGGGGDTTEQSSVSSFAQQSDGDYESDDRDFAPPAALCSPAVAGRISRQYSHVTTEELLPRVQGLVAAVVESELLALSEDETLLLLKHFSWDRRKLEERWFDDPDALRARCGVSASLDPPPLPHGALPGSSFFCTVTMEDTTYADADACACGHWFSGTAWCGHLSSAVLSYELALAATCPEAGCRELCRPRMMKRHLDGPQLARYWEWVSRSFAESSRAARWCPAPGCRFVVLHREGGAAGSSGEETEVTCGGGHAFCFACRESPPHRPASCAEVVRWRATEKDEGGNAKWLVAHTKPCPKCKKPIEKNQGCNHMVREGNGVKTGGVVRVAICAC